MDSFGHTFGATTHERRFLRRSYTSGPFTFSSRLITPEYRETREFYFGNFLCSVTAKRKQVYEKASSCLFWLQLRLFPDLDRNNPAKIQCNQIWQFRAIWAIFRGPLAHFFLRFIYCWVLLGQNSYLLVAIFS